MQLAADKLPTITKLLFGFRFDSHNYRTTIQVGTPFNVPANACAILLANHDRDIFVRRDACEVECGRMNSMGRTGE